jgi:hypothetical protein
MVDEGKATMRNELGFQLAGSLAFSHTMDA